MNERDRFGDPYTGEMLVFDGQNQCVYRCRKGAGLVPTLLLSESGLPDGEYDVVVFNDQSDTGFKRRYLIEYPKPRPSVTAIR